VSVRYQVRHRTAYQYSEAMTRGHTVTHLLPRRSPRQTVLEATVEVDPAPDERFEFDDAFGNAVVQFVLAAAHDRLEVIANSVVLVEDAAPVTDTTPWDAPTTWAPPLAGFVAASPFAVPAEAVEEFARPSMDPGRPIAEAATDLCRRIFEEFVFDPASTDIATPLADVLRQRRGVCQDFAHLAVGCLRAFGLPARYVSGYVETISPPGRPKLVGSDASHAWCSVGLGDGTWFDLDPTNNQAPPTGHVVVAYGRDYLDVAPVLGVVVGPPATQELTVEVDVSSSL
jgi:transglutaminase-like putative cysteine protease